MSEPLLDPVTSATAVGGFSLSVRVGVSCLVRAKARSWAAGLETGGHTDYSFPVKLNPSAVVYPNAVTLGPFAATLRVDLPRVSLRRGALHVCRAMALAGVSYACIAAEPLVHGVGPASVPPAPAYPLKVSANGRYLVDQEGVPFLMQGDSPQAMFVNLSEAEADSFLQDRASLGFNTVWVNLLCVVYTGGRADGSTFDRILPFTNSIGSHYDLTAPNTAYFERADHMISAAASLGIQVLLDPIETGGWLDTMAANGTNRCRTYGRFLGTRYAAFDNLIWMSGNDFQGWRDAGNDVLVRAVASGILETDPRHLQTSELDYLISSSLDDSSWNSILSLNATYTYFPTYAQLLKDYNRPNFLPNFMVEANYEFEHDYTGPATLRRQEYWAMLSGATGQLYGNGYTWPFTDGWQSHLDTSGAAQFALVQSLFAPRAWYELVPDQDHALVTAGYGTFAASGSVNTSDYVAAARTSDGTLAMAYLPSVRNITVDMSRLSAAVTARWYDPSSGDYTMVGGGPITNTGALVFVPPGSNADGDGDWVLLLETAPLGTNAPSVQVTAPTAGQTLSGTVALAADASSDTKVAGVQFLVDGTKVGVEDILPPYSTAWDTTTVLNGPHTITARARDVAANAALSPGVDVVVSNAVPAPPTEGLGAAYAFDELEGSTSADTSGNGNTMTLHGAHFVPGKTGNALSFNGSSDYAEAGNSPSLDVGPAGLTVAFWVKINRVPGGTDYVIVGQPWFANTMTSPFYQYGVEYSNSGSQTLDFYFGDPMAGLHGPFRMTPTTGAWTHVAYTYDGGTVKGYLDGAAELSFADGAGIQTRGNSLRLGVDGAYQQFFNGSIDDLRIYGRALQAAEVRSVMQTAVSLQPPAQPKLNGVQLSGVNLVISISTVPGVQYELQRSGTLGPSSWSAIKVGIPGSGSDVLVTLTNEVAGREAFYRVKATR